MYLNFEGSEKRSERRIKTEYKISFRLAGHDHLIFGQTWDISYGGLRLFTTDKLPIGAAVDFSLHLGDTLAPLEFSGHVAHISEAGEEGYVVGIRFGEMDSVTRESLQRLITSIDILQLLSTMIKKEASDLHLSIGRPPLFRKHEKLLPHGEESLSADRIRRMIYSVMDAGQIEQFEKNREANFALTVPDIGRWRVNVHYQQGFVEATYRAIGLKIKSIEHLGLPPVVADLARSPSGLVIVAGPAGAGKSTTLAAMINLINNEFDKVIISLEDPIEFLHVGRRSVVKQREVGNDTLSFSSGLKNLLRQDPDVIFIGEVRDRQTLSVALTAAETGHLVLTSLNTSNAMQTIHRVLGLFPPDQRQEAAVQFAASLRGVICQRLIPRPVNDGLAVATEVLVATPAVRAVIRDMKIGQITTLIQTGAAVGMHGMDVSLKRLAQRGIITPDVAHALSDGTSAQDPSIRETGKSSITDRVPTAG